MVRRSYYKSSFIEEWWALVDDLRAAELDAAHVRALFMNGDSGERRTRQGCGGPV